MDEAVRTTNVPAAPDLRVSALIYTRDKEAEEVIRAALGGLVPSAEFVSGTVDTAVEQLAERASPRLLFVDVTGSAEPVAQINSLGHVCEPGTAVIVIGDTNDIRLYRDLRRAGVVEYYFKPLVARLVTLTASAVLSGDPEKQAEARTGRLVFVLGVRGGAGATTIATSVAWNLAERLKRRVALVDLDLYAGDAALQLDAAPTHALHEALEHPERVDDLFLDRATIHVTERLSLLSSLEKLSEFTIPKDEAVLPLLEKLINRHRYVIVDAPPAPASLLPRMLALPSVCLFVSDASLVSARDVLRWREVIGSSGPERQILHILNKNGSHGSLPMDEFVRAAGQAPDITIPYDRDIGVASNVGVRGVQKCATLQHGLLPLFRLVAGEAALERRSFLHRLLRRA